METIFRAKTAEAYTMRNLIDLLQNNLKTACFEITSDGIKLNNQDSSYTILITVELNSTKFLIFDCDTMLKLGINLKHFHKVLKSVKKKDIVEFFIKKETEKLLSTRITTKECNSSDTTSVQIQEIQNIETDMSTDYNYNITIPSNNFQKTIKEMDAIGSTINIISGKSFITFECNEGDIIQRSITFGEQPGEEEMKKGLVSGAVLRDEYKIPGLFKLIKISTLSNMLTIYTKKDYPLLLTSDVGLLGKIQIYIKSKSMVDN